MTYEQFVKKWVHTLNLDDQREFLADLDALCLNEKLRGERSEREYPRSKDMTGA